MKTLVTSLLIIHVAAGTIALLVGLVPMFSKKGGTLHNRTGLVYVWCMITVAVTALLLCGLQPFRMLRLFLTGVAVFSFYLCMTGWRTTKQKKTGPARADKILTYGTLVVSVAMVGFGAYLLTGGVSMLPVLFSVFGFLTFRNAWYDFRSFGKTPEKGHWFYHHITRMGGSYIATFTAFLVNNVDRMMPHNTPTSVWMWISTVSWIAPGIVGGVIIGRTIRYYKAKQNFRLPLMRNGVKPVVVATLLSLVTPGLRAAAPTTPVQLTGQVVDVNQNPVPYASLGVLNTPVGTVADGHGQFTLHITDKVKTTDTVRISLIGYRWVSFTVANFSQRLAANPRVVLEEQPRQLAEVRIDAKSSKVKTLGKTGYRSLMVTNFALSELPRQNLGSEIGRRFNLSKGVNRLEKYQFYVITNYDTVHFRINVYRAKDMTNLLPQNIYVTVSGKDRKWVDVDLLPYQIVTSSEDVIVSVQWVDSVGAGTAVQMPIQVPAVATHYYRYGSQDQWKKFRGITTSMNPTFTRGRT